MPEILTERRGRVLLIRLNRPEKLNALTTGMLRELSAALDAGERDDEVGVFVLTGGERAFAAGADVGEIAGLADFAAAAREDFPTEVWHRVSACRKVVIAAVAGHALGGGCELAMMCDIILAADNAKFGQPEILLGTMPGAGGTQRLARAAGKSKAMEMCLTGRTMDAGEAERVGLAARVVPAESLEAEAMALAEKIAGVSLPAARMVKEAVNAAFPGLAEGLRLERRLFHSTFALEDRREGTRAFLEKRKAEFRHR